MVSDYNDTEKWKCARFALKQYAATVFVDSWSCVDGFLGNNVIAIYVGMDENNTGEQRGENVFSTLVSSIYVAKGTVVDWWVISLFSLICMSVHITPTSSIMTYNNRAFILKSNAIEIELLSTILSSMLLW